VVFHHLFRHQGDALGPEELLLDGVEDEPLEFILAPGRLRAILCPQAPGACVVSVGFAAGLASLGVPDRASDAEDWMNYAEREAIPSGLGRTALPLVRGARHRLTTEGYELATLEFVAEKLRLAVIEFTPPADPDTVTRLAAATRAIRDKFHAWVMADMAARRRTSSAAAPSFFAAVSPWGDGKRWHLDRDTRLPAELRRFLDRRAGVPPSPPADTLQPGLPFGGLMGVTAQTVAYYQNLLAFDRARGVVVRERSLPADWEYGILNGAYSPDLDTIVVSAAANAEDNEALQTLTHETAHSVLHNRQALPHPTPPEQYEAEYTDTIEEREADLVTLVVFTELDLPLEMSDGTTLPAGQWRISDKTLRGMTDDLTYRRVTCAARIIAQAARSGSAPTTQCPVRLSA